MLVLPIFLVSATAQFRPGRDECHDHDFPEVFDRAGADDQDVDLHLAVGQNLDVDRDLADVDCPAGVDLRTGVQRDLRRRVRRNVPWEWVHSPTPATFSDRLIGRDQETRQPQVFSTPMRE